MGTGNQTTSFSRIKISYLKHPKRNLSDLKQEELYKKRTNEISDNLFKKH